MNFFREITKKPWLPADGPEEELRDVRAFAIPRATLGLRVLLIAISVLFTMVIVSYGDRMALRDWQPMPEHWLLWPNTAILVLASVALHWAVTAARRGRLTELRRGLLLGGLLSILFLVGQLLVWRELAAAGYYAASNPANAFFYLVTAFHGVHLLGGLIALTKAITVAFGAEDASRLVSRTRLCAVYWHFLFVVWLVLFGLLLFT